MSISLFNLAPLTEEHGKSICDWRYASPFDLYNWSPWDQMVTRQEQFADPRIRNEQYVAVLGALNKQLVGFAQLFPLVGWTRLGLGLRPDLCGKGLGIHFVTAITQEALRRTPDNQIDLEVLRWNERAIRVYEKAGFAITDTYERLTPRGMGTFHCMVYEPE